MSLAIYLNAEYSFTIYECSNFRPITEQDANKIHPVIAQLYTASGRGAVIAALKALQEIAQPDLTTVTSYFFQNNHLVNNFEDYIIKNHTTGEYIQLSLMHINTSDSKDSLVQSIAQSYCIEEMLELVENASDTPASSWTCNVL